MNERIKELAVQAGATLERGFIKLSDGQLMLSDNVDLDKSNMDLEKFAELIVRECVEVMRLVPYDTDREFGDEIIYQDAVKKHFGVE